MKAQLFTSIGLLALVSCQSSLIDTVNRSTSSTLLTEAPTSHSLNYSVPTGSGVEDLVRLSLKHHPAIHAAQERVNRMEAKIPQVESLPDPTAKVGVGSMAETAAGKVNFTAGVEQKVPFPGKRLARGNAVRKEVDAARANVQSLELQLAERVRVAWWNYYLAHRSIGITRDTRELLVSIKDVIQSRIKSGKANQSDLLRLSTEIGKIDKEILIAKQHQASAKAKLNALLNRPTGAPLPLPNKKQNVSRRELSTLVARAEANHPSVQVAEAKLGAFRHRLKLAQLNRYPDFSFGVQHADVSSNGLSGIANGRDQTFATVGVTIPLWQAPRRAKLREAEAGIAEMHASIGTNRSELRHRVEDAWFRAQSSSDIITIFDQRIIPDAKQAFDLSLKSYSSGEVSFVDVLDAWRQLLTYQLQQENNHATLGKASAALKSAAAIR